MLQKLKKFFLNLAWITLCSLNPFAQCSVEIEHLEDLEIKRRDFKNLLCDFSAVLDELEATKASYEAEKQSAEKLCAKVEKLESRLEFLEQQIQAKQQTEKDLTTKLTFEKDRSKELLNKALRQRATACQNEQEKEQIIQKIQQENIANMEQIYQEKLALENEIAKLKKDLDSNILLAQNQALIAAQRKLEAEFKNASSEAITLKKILNDAKAKLASKISDDQNVTTQKIMLLEAEVAIKQHELDSLNKSFNALQSSHAELDEKLVTIKDENRDLRSENTNVTLKFLQDRLNLEYHLGAKLYQVRELAVNKVAAKKKEFSALKETKVTLEEQLAWLMKENEILNSRIQELEQKLSVSKTSSKTAAANLLERLKEQQSSHAEHLRKIKNTLATQVAQKDQRLNEFSKKTESLVLELIRQKKQYSKIFEDLQLAQATLTSLQNAASQNTATVYEPEVDKEEQKLSKILARKLAKLENKLNSTTSSKDGLCRALELARNESEILKTSVDEIYASNDKLTRENDSLKNRFQESEQKFVAMQDQTRELVKREAELIEKIINYENQVADKKSSGKQISVELDQKLQMARADYAKLKAEVQNLVEKLTKSSQMITTLSQETESYKLKLEETEACIADKENNIENLKQKMRTLLANIGLQDDILSEDAKTDYFRMVAEHQINILTDSVLASGKGKMEASLQQVLEDEDLIKKMVAKLELLENQRRTAMCQTNFGKIFSTIHKCKIRAELSKLYGLFLARASSGKTTDAGFINFKKVAAQHFSRPGIEELEVQDLVNPANLIIVCIEGP